MVGPPSISSPGPAAGVASLMRAGPGRKVFRIRKRTEPAGHACHNCHSERSGSTNAVSAEAACELCRARRRETNEVQSRIYFGQGYRCFAALNMTVAAALRKEVNDKRSAVKNLSMYTFIQILRRSAPQNDKLLNCSQTPQQTGISNWRQRGKDGGKRCSGRPQLAEINTGVQPCEPKPRPAEARKTRSAGFGTRTSLTPLSKPGGC